MAEFRREADAPLLLIGGGGARQGVQNVTTEGPVRCLQEL